jgi:thioredoxin reductase (NADPH)
MAGEDVYIVGGANSAGQAALYMSRFAATVTLLVRGSAFREMSEYFVREIGARGNFHVRLNTVVEAGQADFRLRGLVLRDTVADRTEEVAATAPFVMIGAAPRTDWLPEEVNRDERGFVRTGENAAPSGADPNRRSDLETSLPGVFPVDDVRAGSMKRVAAAVGEGSTVIRLVHDFLAQRRAAAE